MWHQSGLLLLEVAYTWLKHQCELAVPRVVSVLWWAPGKAVFRSSQGMGGLYSDHLWLCPRWAKCLPDPGKGQWGGLSLPPVVLVISSERTDHSCLGTASSRCSACLSIWQGWGLCPSVGLLWGVVGNGELDTGVVWQRQFACIICSS